VVGVAKGGIEEGVESLAQSMIIAPSGQIVAQATSIGDELISAHCDLDMCDRYKKTLFDFDRYRRPEMYQLIASTTALSLEGASELTPSSSPTSIPMYAPTADERVNPVDPTAPAHPEGSAS
ncbi:hypothetical protein K0U83_11095, partial [bacterium]|nr:hypothetical protein [bacterium]